MPNTSHTPSAYSRVIPMVTIGLRKGTHVHRALSHTKTVRQRDHTHLKFRARHVKCPTLIRYSLHMAQTRTASDECGRIEPFARVALTPHHSHRHLPRVGRPRLLQLKPPWRPSCAAPTFLLCETEKKGDLT
jgi:hypothetical protein